MLKLFLFSNIIILTLMYIHVYLRQFDDIYMVLLAIQTIDKQFTVVS